MPTPRWWFTSIQALSRTAVIAIVAATAGCGSKNEPDEQPQPPAPAPAADGAAASQSSAPAPSGSAAPATASAPSESKVNPAPAGAAATPRQAVELFFSLLLEGRFREAAEGCDPAAPGTQAIIKLADGFDRAQQEAGTTALQAKQFMIADLRAVRWEVLTSDDTSAKIVYTAEGHGSAEFTVKSLEGVWLVAPPPSGLPLPPSLPREGG